MKHDPDYQEQWRLLLTNYENSNMSIKEFCLKNDLKTNKFYYWHDKLIKGKVRNQNKTQSVVDTPSFVKVNPINSTSNGSIKIESCGVTLHVEDGFNHDLLKTVLKTVKDLD